MTSKSTEKIKTTDQKFKEALSNLDLPRIYANGIVVGTGLSDVILVLEQNGSPVATLNVSYTTAKTLATELTAAITNLEKLSGQEIMTLKKVENYLSGKSEAADESK